MTVIIYTIRTENHYQLGTPAAHTLDEPAGISREWITRAEYDMPDGYTVSRSNSGTHEIYNAAGHHCPLADSAWMGKGDGSPILVDSDAASPRVKLSMVCDLPW